MCVCVSERDEHNKGDQKKRRLPFIHVSAGVEKLISQMENEFVKKNYIYILGIANRKGQPFVS